MRAEEESSGHLAAWTVRPTASRASAEEAPLATVFTEGRAHRIRHANAAFCRLSGRPKGELLNQPLDRVLRPADAPAPAHLLESLLTHVFDSGIPNVVSEVAFQGEDLGCARRLTALASPIVNENTGEEGLLVHLLDRTEQADTRRANEALLLAGLRQHARADASDHENERMSALVEHLADGIAMLDGDGQPILVNPAGRALLGIEDVGESSLQRYMDCAFYTASGARLTAEGHPARRAASGETFVNEEITCDGPQGPRRLLFSGASVRREGGEIVLAINAFRDVTELRQLEQTREEYIALVSHDLRGPLHGVLLNAELLIEALDGEQANPAPSRYAAAIMRLSRRMAAMVEELYRSSQLESDRYEMRCERVSPTTLLAELIDAIDPGQRRRLAFEVDESAAGSIITVDCENVQRALMNLVTNALKYSPATSPVTIALELGEREVRFCVRDRGPGIPEAEVPTVFEKYHRGRVATDRDGMGLGLYIAKRIVEAHGGRIFADSTVGVGTTFVVALPRSTGQARPKGR